MGEQQSGADGGESPVQGPAVTILVETAAKLNFAAHQSSFAFLRDLRIVNNDPALALSDVVVTMSASPAFLKPKSWHMDRLAPASTLAVKNRDVDLDGGFLLDLTESIRGTVTIGAKAGDRLLGQEQKVVELLAYNEWGGGGYMPELLAAFAMPNDPAIDRVLRDASTSLRKAGKPDGIDGYKSGSRQRVWEIASAIYTAVSNLGIAYALPPASFEKNGQKIRLPSQILEGRLATCLDTTMLFASALEQAGLNPIIALPQGHAFVGVWLQPEELASIVVDEAEMLRKRVQLNELVLIETTFATSRPAPPFSTAISAANDCISPDKDETFLAGIDIRRARAHRITPLGRKVGGVSGVGDGEQHPQVEQALEDAPPLPDFDGQVEEDGLPETPAGRLERWQRKLLDLSARNPLLNHKSSKTSLRLICPNPALLEDGLAAGARFAIQAVPTPSSVGQDEEVHRQRTGEIIIEEYARAALDKKQVLVDLPEEELNRRAVEIYRKAQTALQEGGANTLYLAIGFLLWKQDEKSDRRFRAPLILLPVTLERKSVRSGVRMLAHDDEPRFNTTLLEMLRKDFRIDIRDFDGPLPADVNGIDVASIWERMRRAVKDAPGFEVVEDVALGHFSFAKYLMWKDLVDRTDALRKNAVVKHLLDTPRDRYGSEIDFVEGRDIDRKYHPSELLTPLPADASQMAAIATADRGKDFIVIGPPGTGKSQTISNMIAHILGQGKTVLFVSEKTAALEVVQRRLKAAGLGQFCLELHSNKASKADVLNQLRDAWSYAQHASPSDWEREGERLRDLRDRLNLIVDRLHLPRRNGLTAHHAIGLKVRDASLTMNLKLTWPSGDYHDEAGLRALLNAVEKLRIQVAAVGSVSESPFEMVTHDDWSPQWEVTVAERAARLSASMLALERSCEGFLKATGIDGLYRNMPDLQALADLASILVECWQKQVGYALEPNGAEKIDALTEVASRLRAFGDVEASLSCPYESMAWRNIDGDVVGRRWQAATSAWWPKSFFARRSVVRELKEGGAQGVPVPAVDAPLLARLRQEGNAIDRLGDLLTGAKGWRGHGTDPSAMLALKELGVRVRAVIGRLAKDSTALVEARAKIRTLLENGDDLLAPEALVGRAAADLTNAHASFLSAYGDFAVSAGELVRERLADAEDVLSAIKQTTGAIETRHAELRDWCHWRRRRTEAIELGLEPLVKSIEGGLIPVEEIETTFYAAYCAWWSAAIIGEDDILRTFSTDEHVDAIEKFRQVDAEYQKLTAAEIAARLSGKVPGASQQNQTASWGTLRKEMQKKTRHKPVRQLVQEAPDALTALKPCLMMSPLSVAQYLPADHSPFDVVIFDEASQITVWDAVGALARGKQVIVAGDPKQMPPSNFFARSDDDPDGDVDVEGDLESILDEMLGASIPQRTLNLHYRSRRESLIAFSNSRYYDNSLVTFPAPVNPDQGVRLVRPAGFYARGAARHNEGEAKAIVAEVVRRLTHPDSEISKASIGVVTFNSEQQTLIENLLDDARSKRPDIEWAFSQDTVAEPVFVKNLETVQGDERDIILFSVTYGPDQSGHVTMNFGPLNRSGGERRLNVALTRARSELVVFSTLDPKRIDLSRTQARAVADLKHFLEYAEQGATALGAAVYGSKGDFESPFEAGVARALRAKGWTVHTQIGVSAYRVDLGVVHPDFPGVYLAGVECDGAMYHSSAFARERDKIRQSVLEGLGWTLFRVWSTDWWTHSAKALDKLDRALATCLEAARAKSSKQVAMDDVSQPAATDVSALEETIDDDPPSEGERVEVPLSAATQPLEAGHFHDRVLPRTPSSVSTEPDGSNLNSATAVHYVFANLDQERYSADFDQFYFDSYEKRLAAMIDHVIDTEGPIHEDVLIKRIARHHGVQRITSQFRECVSTAARRRRGKTHEADIGTFFWRKGTAGDRITPARHTGRDDELRNLDFICREELRAIHRTLALGEDPVELARLFGTMRLSQVARTRIVKALAK